jgi:gamma-glutamylaminecyclotransferase
MLIFVYGSLKKDFQNHYLLEDSKYIGEATTTDFYTMIGTKSKAFPYIISNYPDNAGTCIKGEVYDISEEVLEKLDKLEGHPDTYTRRNIYVSADKDSLIVFAYILDNQYILNNIIKYIGKRFEIIEDGIWKNKPDK